jgi:hypothetical protein
MQAIVLLLSVLQDEPDPEPLNAGPSRGIVVRFLPQLNSAQAAHHSAQSSDFF